MKTTTYFCDCCGEKIPDRAMNAHLEGQLLDTPVSFTDINLEDVCYVCNSIILQAINTCKNKKKKK